MMIGPAGSGKSTLCHVLQEIGDTNKRNFKIVNLDPAAEVFKYRCSLDIRDMVALDDVQELMNFGPNGGLVYCMEYLIENIDEFLKDLSEFEDESFIIFDCPGQIELYSHLDVMTRLTKAITNAGFNLCSIYCADGTYINEPSKYVSACLTSLSTMTQISLPHLNVLTKCDKVQDKELLERMSTLNYEDCFSSENSFFNKKYMGLHQKLFEVIENFNLVQFTHSDIQDEDSIQNIIMHLDNLVQYDEYRMPKDGAFLDNQEGPEENEGREVSG